MRTSLQDYKDSAIESLVHTRGWRALNELKKIQSIYDFVRNEIVLGFNSRDALPASVVLRQGYGQCNTKAILLAALLTAVNVPNRVRAMTVSKRLQQGLPARLVYRLAPDEILHSWVEEQYQGRWYVLEGVIADEAYLQGLRRLFPDAEAFCGWGVSTHSLKAPPVEFYPSDTYIQSASVLTDFGLYGTPDELLQKNKQTLSPLKNLVYKLFVRHGMNRRLRAVRMGKLKKPRYLMRKN